MVWHSKDTLRTLLGSISIRCVQDEAEDGGAGGQQVVIQGRLHCQQHRCLDEPWCVVSEGQVRVVSRGGALHLARGYWLQSRQVVI